jgi:hypothetical protein
MPQDHCSSGWPLDLVWVDQVLFCELEPGEIAFVRCRDGLWLVQRQGGAGPVDDRLRRWLDDRWPGLVAQAEEAIAAAEALQERSRRAAAEIDHLERLFALPCAER